MKKLFLFIYLAGIAAYFGYSQMSLSLSDSTGALANNSTIYKSGTPDADEVVAYVFVTNNSANDLSLLVKKVIIDTVPGSVNMFCWGLCFAPNVYVSPNPITVKAGRTDSIHFSGHYVPMSHPGTSKIQYVFYDRGNSSDSVCVNVVFQAYPLAIETPVVKATLSTAYPNPANGAANVQYSVPAGVKGSLVIRNLLGNTVREIPLEEGSGNLVISTSDLADGVYFYSIISNGKQDSSRKLIVRH